MTNTASIELPTAAAFTGRQWSSPLLREILDRLIRHFAADTLAALDARGRGQGS